MWEGLSESLSPFYVSKVQNERSKFHSMEGVGREVRTIEYINISSTFSENLSLDMKYGKIKRSQELSAKAVFLVDTAGLHSPSLRRKVEKHGGLVFSLRAATSNVPS